MLMGALFKAMQTCPMSWANPVRDSKITINSIFATKDSILDLLGSSQFPEAHQRNPLLMDSAGKHASGKEF